MKKSVTIKSFFETVQPIIKKFNYRRKVLATVAIFLLAVLIFLILPFFYLGHKFKSPFFGQEQPVEITIEPGWGVRKIAETLESERIIESNFYFNFYVWQKNWDDLLQAGNYQFQPGLSVAEVAEMIKSGLIVENEVTVTFPPGQRIERINTILKRADFDAEPEIMGFTLGDFADDFELLKDLPAKKNLEGFLYPETITFFKDVTSSEIIRKMLEVFDKNVDQDLREAMAEKDMDFYEVLTLASIVEKEMPASKPEDRRLVAGVFWNRLQQGRPLQSCVTIEYILGKHKLRYSVSDTLTPSPYNTYINLGLPPTPIASPSRGAIEAVVFYEPSDYLFFLSDPQTGRTIFSVTGQEHEANVNKYLN